MANGARVVEYRYMRIRHLVIPLITLLVALTGSWLTGGGMGWYRTIALPSWTPPGYVIGMVWTVLFVLAMISALIVFGRPDLRHRRLIARAFIVNALLNVGWSLAFFNQHLIGVAVFVAAVLGASVIALIVLIRPISRTAAWLIIPYAAWVAFATFLNYQIWRLN